MNKFMKKVTLFLFLSIFMTSFFSLSSVYAESEVDYVVDNGDFLTEEEEAELTEIIEEIVQRQEFDIVVLTGLTEFDFPQDIADDFYDYNGYREDGVLFYVSETSWAISTSGEGIDVYTEYNLDEFENKCVDLVRNGEYYDAFTSYANFTDDLLNDSRSFSWFLNLIIF